MSDIEMALLTCVCLAATIGLAASIWEAHRVMPRVDRDKYYVAQELFLEAWGDLSDPVQCAVASAVEE